MQIRFYFICHLFIILFGPQFIYYCVHHAALTTTYLQKQFINSISKYNTVHHLMNVGQSLLQRSTSTTSFLHHDDINNS